MGTMDDVFSAAAEILTLASNGISFSSMSGPAGRYNRQDVKLLVDTLVFKRLLQYDSRSSSYWTTVEGMKFLEIHNMLESFLKPQKNLV